jgi:hypothetical protein
MESVWPDDLARDEGEHFAAEIVHTKRVRSGGKADVMKMRE